jgi:exodeoxyribonuclease VII small subunit
MARKQQETLAFEKSLKELEALVAKMEQGNLSLEESLQHFERGIRLTRTCQQALREAEQKVEILLKKSGQDDIAPFSSDDA